MCQGPETADTVPGIIQEAMDHVAMFFFWKKTIPLINVLYSIFNYHGTNVPTLQAFDGHMYCGLQAFIDKTALFYAVFVVAQPLSHV